MKRTVIDDFAQAVSVEPGYEDFFAGLVEIANGGRPDAKSGEALRRYVYDFLGNCDLRRFHKKPDEPYTRIYLGRDEATGWEAIMMCWAKGSATSIHGHPAFAAYNFADGRFRVEFFKMDGEGYLTPSQTVETVGGDGFFAVGRPGRFDNHIHRITCLSGTGHSLHIYCGDARKGVVFDEAELLCETADAAERK